MPDWRLLLRKIWASTIAPVHLYVVNAFLSLVLKMQIALSLAYMSYYTAAQQFAVMLSLATLASAVVVVTLYSMRLSLIAWCNTK